jgi:8-oxo-dGTP pyrophosphatase MutT (NUDIX family)
MVRAAGGIISRRNERGEVEVLLIHRPGHDDWSLPKGKVEPGETDEQCALREVREETSLRCALGPELPPVSYHDAQGHAKCVRYWAMSATEGEARPQNEVDAVRWIGIADAARLLSYATDRDLLVALAALPH